MFSSIKHTKLHNFFFKVPTSELLKNKEWRDAVATRAFYTSETQKYLYFLFRIRYNCVYEPIMQNLTDKFT